MDDVPWHLHPVSDAWECACTEAGTACSPGELPRLEWLPAPVPGTFALALRRAGRWDGLAELKLDQHDIWYRTSFAGGGDEILHFQGLATIADVWLNGIRLFSSDNMFLERRASVRTESVNDLHICFRSLNGWLAGQRGRARWRQRLVTPSNLRFARTTLLGHMPGWCPVVHPVGPWRPILRETRNPGIAVEAVDVRTAVFDREGRVVIRAVLDRPADVEAVASVDGHSARLERTGPRELQGTIAVPDAALWWPHTHGSPTVSPLCLRIDDTRCELGNIGFRHIQASGGADGNGFALEVNNEPVFCRGACWTASDIVALPGEAAAYRPWLTAMRDAGMNMVRIGGTMVYEADAFYALCDELGLLVWQDAMLANFDYPATESFRESLAAELRQFLDRTQTSPSLAVFCGGSEVWQQAAMLGLPDDRIDVTLYTQDIPPIVADIRPDIVYVPNSPSGGAWPFQTDTGITHYYGVGAYRRPLDDARRSAVRFASECLALSNVPEAALVDALGVASTTDPTWKRAIPRDPGAGWDFEDVRDHYLAQLFGIDPINLRWTDFARYLDVSRAVSCTLAEALFGEWRRVGSSCAGGLVWQLQDLAPGAGWGILDSRGEPKPIWHALRRAFRPIQVILTDEGLNGLHVHVLNETSSRFHMILSLVCLKDGCNLVRESTRSVELMPRSRMRFDSAGLLPGFFDISDAYRFGPRIHDVTVATLRGVEDDTPVAESFHFPAGPDLAPRDLGLQARLERSDDLWALRLRTNSLATFLHIQDAHYRPDDNWLHLPPGRERRIVLRSRGDSAAPPCGEIRALNLDRVVRYGGPA